MLAVQPGAKALQTVTDMIVESGARLSIERTFPLEQAIDALAHHGEGRSLGKIVVAMGGSH
ncbi:MAG: zinc-binding dehydrogenase [Myxococcales bacterium]|nr:zinc-binding dehydrogenase [Myxococcales bacterium]